MVVNSCTEPVPQRRDVSDFVSTVLSVVTCGCFGFLSSIHFLADSRAKFSASSLVANALFSFSV